MKITCDVCGAKYAVADEKVRGRTVRVKCKKCGTTIVVTDPALAGGEGAGADPMRAEWLVNIDEDDQRTVTVAEIADLQRQGVIDAETYVWREGMAEWLPLGTVAELVDALRAGGGSADPAGTSALDLALDERMSAAPAAESSLPPGAPSNDASRFAPRASAPAPRASAPAPRASAPAPRASAPAPRGSAPTAGTGIMAPLGGGRPSSPVNAVGASRASASTGAAGGGDRRVGERNDNSVLFSLGELAPGRASPNPAMGSQRSPFAGEAQNEASGLIDMRHLAGALKAPAQKKDDRIDDIMNLGGAPIFTPAIPMAAPTYGQQPTDGPTQGDALVSSIASSGAAAARAQPAYAPPAAATPVLRPASSSGGKRTGIIVGAVALLGAVAAAFALTRSKTEEPLATASHSEPAVSASAQPVEPAHVEAPSPVASIAKAPEPLASVATPPHDGTSPDALPTTRDPHGRNDKRGKHHDDAKPADEPAPKKAPEPPPAPAPVAAPAPPPAAAGGGGDQPFDRGAALGALGSAASAAASCKSPSGPTGSGRVAVTFAPSGNATSANVEGPPFAGTSVGGCIASKFQKAKVPAFSGSPITVRKSFTIN